MIHLRTDDHELNKDAVFVCGISWPLPEGDKYVFEGEHSLVSLVTCKGCIQGTGEQVIALMSAHEVQHLGTPISEISTQPGTPGYAEWLRICRSWGHE